MPRFIIISGPQSSGKSTVFKYLREKYVRKNIKFIPEINPYEVVRTDHPKYLSVYGLQETLTKKTLDRISKINNKTDYIMETGILQIVYIEKYSTTKKAEHYFKKYVEIAKHLNPFIIFIDTKPAISFKRRKKVYEERIIRHELAGKKKEILKQYEDKIYDLYPMWHKWLKRFPFQKMIVKNSYKSEKQYISEVESLVNHLLTDKN